MSRHLLKGHSSMWYAFSTEIFLSPKFTGLIGTTRNSCENTCLLASVFPQHFSFLQMSTEAIVDLGEGPGLPLPFILGKNETNHRRKKSRQGKQNKTGLHP